MFEFREAARRILATPTLSAILTLSLTFGIAADIAIFKVFNELSWRLLSVSEPNGLIVIAGQAPNAQINYSYPMYRDLRDTNQSLTGLVGYWPTSLAVESNQTAERIQAEFVSGNYHSVLGVSSLVGRLINPSDETVSGGAPVVVLSHGFWTRHFGADTNVVGRSLRLNGYSFTVVGVLNPRFRGFEVGSPPDVQLPVNFRRITSQESARDPLTQSNSLWLRLVGRLRPGFTMEHAQSEIDLLYTKSPYFPRLPWPVRTIASSGARGVSALRSEYSKPLIVLLILVSLTFLAACINLASLMLARTMERNAEYATRLALGASLLRLARLPIWEALLFSAVGGLLGLLLSVPLFQLLLAYLPIQHPTEVFTSTPDGTLLAFAFLVTALSCFLLGAVPALHLRRLASSSSSMLTSHSGARFSRALSTVNVFVSAQLALSLLLLTTGFLLSKTLSELNSTDLGYGKQNLLMLSFNPGQVGLTPSQSASFYSNLMTRIRNMPMVHSAGVAFLEPLTKRENSINFCFEGRQRRADENLEFHYNPVSDGYLSASGIALLAGRDFNQDDFATSRKVALINDRLAKSIFGGQSPIGRRLGLACEDDAKADLEIIGVTKTTKFQSIRESEMPMVYLPYTLDEERQLTLMVRMTSDAHLILPAIREQVRDLNPRIPVFDLKTLDSHISNTLSRERLLSFLSVLLSAITLLLAGLGIFGSASNLVVTRRREIGIRMALGAQMFGIWLLIARHAAIMLISGGSVGLALSLALAKTAEAILYRVSPTDASSVVYALFTLSAITLLAVAIPAYRALRIDPALAIRRD